MPELVIPAGIREYLETLIRQRWDSRPAPGALPATMPPGTVQHLVRGGPFGWLVEARLDEIEGRVALECLEDSRIAGPDHYRVWDDGTREDLPNEQTAYGTPPGCPPDERARIEAAYHEHNRTVQALLRERGFRAG